MPSLADLLENYRNWKGRQDWQSGKEMQDYFGGDPVAQEQFEKLSGFGTADLGGLSGLAGAIKASHGSPHAFEKFDFSKIGTGEGAQAYGHGGYFAQGFDSPVAKEYQKQLAANVQLKGQPFYSGKSGKQLATTGNPELDDYLMANLGDVGAARTNLLADLRDVRSGGGDVRDYQRTLADLRNIRGDVENADLGHLYNVELKWPNAAREASDPLGEHHLLDWDAPMSQQSANIKEALQSHPAVKNRAEAYFNEESKGLSPIGLERMKKLTGGVEGILGKTTGANAYRAIVQYLENNPELASKELSQFGIPGIRYLNQGSRGQGSGTRNYVMFDDQFPNIVSRNGASLSDLLDTSYQSGHTAPGPDFGAPLHDLTGGGEMYPQDIYSKNAARLYGDGVGHEAIDKKAMSLVQMLRNQPEALVDIYRAVPNNESISSINPGDWVTITKEYAKEHGEGPLRGDYKILKQKVPAKSIWTNADSIHEYGYWPDR